MWTSWSCLALLDTAGFLGVTWRRLALSRDGDWFHIAALVVFNSLLEAPIRTIGFVALRNPHSFRRVTVVVDSSLMFHFKDQRIDADVNLASTRPREMIDKVACQRRILAAGRTDGFRIFRTTPTMCFFHVFQ